MGGGRPRGAVTRPRSSRFSARSRRCDNVAPMASSWPATEFPLARSRVLDDDIIDPAALLAKAAVVAELEVSLRVTR